MARRYLKAYHLGTTERKDYTIDLGAELNSGETVQSVEILSEPSSDIQITAPIVDAATGLVLFWAETPKAATAYAVTARGVLSNGRVVEGSILLAGIEKAPGQVVATWP